MDSMKEPTKLTYEQQRSILRLIAAHHENRYAPWTIATCVIVYLAEIVAIYHGVAALAASRATDWAAYADVFYWSILILGILNPFMTDKVKALFERIDLARVKKLHNKDVSAQQIAKIQKIGCTYIVRKLAECDSRYIEKLLDGGLDNVPVAAVKAIMDGSRESHPEYNQGIMTELNNILWDYNRAKQVKTK